MLPYATEQQVLKIVEQKLRENGGGSTPSEDEIIAIVNKAIEDGDINVSAFEDVEIRIYGSDLTLIEGGAYISNQEKIEQIEKLLTAFKNKKLIIGRIDAPRVTYGVSETSLELYIQSICSDGGNKDENAEAINMYDGNVNYCAGFSKLWLDDTNAIYITNVTIGSENTEYVQAMITLLFEDTTKYIQYTFRVEK